jgi:hypothetical protein
MMKQILIAVVALSSTVLFTSCPSTQLASGIAGSDASTLRSLAPTLLGQSTRVFKGSRATTFAARDAIALGEHLGNVKLNRTGKVKTQGANDPCQLPSGIVDEDGDGYPKTLDAALNCTEDGVKITGQIRIADGDDTDPESGFSAAFQNFTLSAQSGSDPVTIKYDQSNSVTVKSGGYTDTQKLTFSITVGKDTAGLSTNSSLTYVPASDGDNDNWDSGTVNFSDTLEVFSGSDRASFGVKGTALNLNPNCTETGVDAGSLEFSAGSDVLKLQVTGCDEGTWTLNGQAAQ